jgi:hypothetical protein
MPFLLLQATGGLQVDPAWLVTTIAGLLGTLATVIAFLYRQQVNDLRETIQFLKDEGKHKDERAEKIIDQLGRVADLQDRGLSLVEAERRRR